MAGEKAAPREISRLRLVFIIPESPTNQLWLENDSVKALGVRSHGVNDSNYAPCRRVPHHLRHHVEHGEQHMDLRSECICACLGESY